MNGEKGEHHAYVELIGAREIMCRETYLVSLEAKGLRVHQGQQARAAADVIANVTLRNGDLEAIADVLVHVAPSPSMKRPCYEPQIALGTLTVTLKDRIRLAFVGHVLAKACHQRPGVASGVFHCSIEHFR